MPEARKITCTVLEKIWLTPTVVRLRFEPSRKIKFTEGQFLSLMIPLEGQSGFGRRAYSLSSPYSKYKGLEGYELCVKHVPGGLGSSYVARLHKGDIFEATAPYGDFIYEPKPNRSACFISTGTGVAPFRAIVLGKEFRENPPVQSISLFGCATEEEIIYPGFFESLGFHTYNCVSDPKWNYKGFHGRVTDCLNEFPLSWGWHKTEFYLCGNGNMVEDVKQILKAHGVQDSSIHKEVYFAAADSQSQKQILEAQNPPPIPELLSEVKNTKKVA